MRISIFVQSLLLYVSTSSSVVFRRPRSFLNEWDRVHALGPWVDASKGQPWPLPQKMETNNRVLNVHPSFKFRVSNFSCDILRKAFRTYKPYVLYRKRKRNISAAERAALYEASPVLPIIRTLRVVLKKPCEHLPYFGMDESYSLDVGMNNKRNAVLTSESIWGILRGLETFTQLFYKNDEGRMVINRTSIEDFPRFPHRGILLDTSRHYLPVGTIKKNLDLMAMNKMNVFHWHIVDDNSFPYQSKKFPELSNKGAYSQSLIYTQEDVRGIIEYARLRGIRVMSEFDTPGHTQSWGPGQPDLLTQCKDQYGRNINGSFGPVNPAKEANYEFMREFFQEVAIVFPEKFVHLGGDEVNSECWDNDPEIRSFMDDHDLNTGKDMQGYYINKLIQMIKELRNNNTMMVWQEMFDNSAALDPEAIVHVWKGGDFRYEMYQVTNSGRKVILSACWYLNYIKYGVDWHKLYNCDPTDGLPPQRRDLVLGGEAAMWGEYVDETNLIPRLWPRASAVAERLWSDKTTTSAMLAAPRMEEHRCRLRERGYRVQPATGSGYCP